MTITNVVHGIWRYGKPIIPCGTIRSLLHHTNDAFDDIVNVRKITLAITIVENLYRLTFNQFIGETKICHVRPAGRPIDRKETQSRGRNVIQLTVCMCHQFVGFLRSRIQTNRIIHFIARGKWYFRIATVNRRTRRIYQMLNRMMTTCLKDIEKGSVRPRLTF